MRPLQYACRLALGLTVLLLACGRTELDQSPGSTGAAGTATGGHGGTAGANPGGRGGNGSGGGQPIPCGPTTCDPGTEACCLQQGGLVCQDARIPCPGFGVTCVDGSSCTAGEVCCLSLLARTTACAAAATCAASIGTVLCSTDAECPATMQCCRVGGGGFCGQVCP